MFGKLHPVEFSAKLRPVPGASDNLFALFFNLKKTISSVIVVISCSSQIVLFWLISDDVEKHKRNCLYNTRVYLPKDYWFVWKQRVLTFYI